MAFIAPLQLLGNNVMQKVIYVRTDLPNCSTSLDDVILKQPQMLTTHDSNLSSFHPVNSLPCLDDLTQRNNDASLLDSFSFLEDKDPLTNATNIALDSFLSQQSLLFNQIPQTPVVNQNVLPERDITHTLDSISDYPLLENNGGQNLLNNLSLSAASEAASLTCNNLDAILSHSVPLKEIENAKVENNGLDCNDGSAPKKRGIVDNDKIQTYTAPNSVSNQKPQNDDDELKTRWPGRPRTDGTYVCCVKKHKKCNHCDKMYLTMNMMRKHIRLAHPEIYHKLTCGKCGKTFDSVEKLVLHAADHWKPREKCPLGGFSSCNIKYSTKPSLRTHICQNHIEGSSTDRPHPCKQCLRSFDKPSQLQRHLLTHNGEKPFQCAMCDRHFNQKNSLTNHMMTHMKQKPHQCSKCSARFTQSYNRFIHLYNTHYKDTRVKGSVECAKCNKILPDHFNAFKHYMNSHKDFGMSLLTRNVSADAKSSSKRNQPIILKTGYNWNELIETKDKSIELPSKQVPLSPIRITNTSNNNQNNIKPMETIQNQSSSISPMKFVTNPSNNTQVNVNFTETIPNQIYSSPLKIVINGNYLNETENLLREFENQTQNMDASFQNPPYNSILSEIGTTLENNLQNQKLCNIGFEQTVDALGDYQNIQNTQMIGELGDHVQIPLNIVGNLGTNPHILLTFNNDHLLKNIAPNQTNWVNATDVLANTNINHATSAVDLENVLIKQNEMLNLNSYQPNFTTDFQNVPIYENQLNRTNLEELVAVNHGPQNNLQTINNTLSILQLPAIDLSNNIETNTLPSNNENSINIIKPSKEQSNISGKLPTNKALLKINHIEHSNELLTNKTASQNRLKMNKKTCETPKPKMTKKCNECSASFAKLSDLKRHFAIHTKEKPYTCTLCNTSYCFKSSLQNHLNRSKTHKKIAAANKLLSQQKSS